jgi:hypothetical protein
MIMAAVLIASPLASAYGRQLEWQTFDPLRTLTRSSMQDIVISAGGKHHSHFGKFLPHEMET